MNMHKNARLMPQGRLLLVQRVTDLGWTVRLAADAAGLCGHRRLRPGAVATSVPGFLVVTTREREGEQCETGEGGQRASEGDATTLTPARRARQR